MLSKGLLSKGLWMRRLVVLLAVASLAGPVVPAQAEAVDLMEPLRGKMTIDAVGNAGIRLSLVTDAFLPPSGIRVQGLDGQMVFVGVGIPADGPRCSFFYGPPIEMSCIVYQVLHAPGSRPSRSDTFVLGALDTPFRPGIVEVYILSSGRARVTLDFDDLGGEARAVATATVNGHVADLAERCYPRLCEQSRFGGAEFELTYPAVLARLVWIRSAPNASGEPNPGLRTYTTCRIRGNAGYSTDPDDYPNGCPWFFDPRPGASPDRLSRDLWSDANYVLETCETCDKAFAWQTVSAGGREYLGFKAHGFSTSGPPDILGGMGAWLDQGMACPSGDFRDCATV